MAEIESLQAERARHGRSTGRDRRDPPPIWRSTICNDLGQLWRDTDDDGRRRLAVATFVNLGVRGVPRAQLHDPKTSGAGADRQRREASEYANAAGLAIAATALEIEVIMVGDTGLEPVTSCMSSKCSNQLS